MKNFKEAEHDHEFYTELQEKSQVVLSGYRNRAFAYFEQLLIKTAVNMTYRGDLILLFFKEEIYGEDLFNELRKIGDVDESQMDQLIEYGDDEESLDKNWEYMLDIMFEECDKKIYLKEFKCQFEKFLNLHDEEMKEAE